MTKRSLALSVHLATRRPSTPLSWLERAVATLLRRRRNAAAAEHLRELPPYLLADIGIERSGIEEIRRHGVPSRRRTACGSRPLHRTTGVDIAGWRP